MPANVIDHIAILVHSADAAIGYFRDTFGLPLVSDERLDGIGVRLAYIDGGSVLLQVVEPTADGPLRDHLARQGEGLHHLCLGVSDIEATVGSLAPERRGTRIAMGGRGRRAVFLPEQPLALRVEVTEREPAGAGGGIEP